MLERDSSSEPSPVLLAAENLEYRYPKQTESALKGVSLTLSRGQCLGLLGPNGSGKSTLINVLIGVLAPQGGSVRHLGKQPLVGWVPQDYAFYPQLNCRENLQFFVAMLDLSRDEQVARVDRLITTCMLQEFVNKEARHCSGGVRRRLNIAIALLQQPDVLLLDEPAVSVDPQSRAVLLEQVRTLAQQGTAIVYATHYMEEVTATCSEILLLNHGNVLASGNLKTLLQNLPGQPQFESLEALFMHHTNRSLRD